MRDGYSSENEAASGNYISYNIAIPFSGDTAIKLKVTTVGNSLGVVLPKELLARLRIEKGDLLFITEVPGGIKLMPHDPAFEEQMTVANGVMRRRRAAA